MAWLDHTCFSTDKTEWREKAQEVTQMRTRLSRSFYVFVLFTPQPPTLTRLTSNVKPYGGITVDTFNVENLTPTRESSRPSEYVKAIKPLLLLSGPCYYGGTTPIELTVAIARRRKTHFRMLEL